MSLIVRCIFIFKGGGHWPGQKGTRRHELFPNETILNVKIPNVKILNWVTFTRKNPERKNPENCHPNLVPFPLT